MRTSGFFAAAGLVLACTLALTGCPPEAGDLEINQGLVNKWTNKGTTPLEKKFEIKADGSFTANLNPTALGAFAKTYGTTLANGSNETAAIAAGGAAAATAVAAVTNNGTLIDTSWEVTGKLARIEGDVYLMNDLKARTTDIIPNEEGTGLLSANDVLKGFSGTSKVTLTVSASSFEFHPENSTDTSIELFFGGTYYKDTSN